MMKRANSADPKVSLPFLAKANYKGVTTTIQFEADGELKKSVDDVLRLQGRQAGFRLN